MDWTFLIAGKNSLKNCFLEKCLLLFIFKICVFFWGGGVTGCFSGLIQEARRGGGVPSAPDKWDIWVAGDLAGGNCWLAGWPAEMKK